jgi:hypothetical protein
MFKGVKAGHIIAVVIGMIAYSLLSPVLDPLLSGILAGKE